MVAFIIECTKYNVPIQLLPMLKIAGLNCMVMGAFIGCEFDKRPDEKYTFIVGPKLETELEVFVAPRIALLGRVQQFWNSTPS